MQASALMYSVSVSGFVFVELVVVVRTFALGVVLLIGFVLGSVVVVVLLGVVAVDVLALEVVVSVALGVVEVVLLGLVVVVFLGLDVVFEVEVLTSRD